MKQNNFERQLPANYRQTMYINAKSAKLGIILNLIALAVLVIVMLIALIPIYADEISPELSLPELSIAGFSLSGALLLYMVLHELVHGIAYKYLTGEKLTFGVSWSCAFCGVPHIYTYRKTALISVVAPLAVFTLILLPLTVALYFVHPVAYLVSAVVFASHLGGCSGDAYILLLLLTKFKDAKVLMRDTGPEQFFYVPESETQSEIQ